MGFFTPDTLADALKQVEKINREMRAVSASCHQNYDQIDGRNRREITAHYNNIVLYLSRYERIQRQLSLFDQVALGASTVDVWNGEIVGIQTWELYVKNTMERLHQAINY